MHRILLILIAAFVVVLFAWSNTHHVEVGLVFGRPVHVRLIFLLLTTFLVGHLSAVLLYVYGRTRIKEKVKREKLRVDTHDDEDEFLLD